jgi:hypothetical protein
MEGKVIEEYKNFHEWGGRTLVRNHQVGGCGFSGRGLTLAAVFLDFPAAGLEAAEILGSDFRGLAVFLLAVTLGCSGASVTGWEE